MAQVKLDMSTFSDANLFELGSKKHWVTLKKILLPITAPYFTVNNPVNLAIVDDARHRLDSAFGGLIRRNALQTVVASNEEGDHEVLKLLLMAGVDPDLPDHGGSHPSHLAAFFGRYKVAKAIFQCRPDMSAQNPDGDTPFGAASKAYSSHDQVHPQRAPLREDIAAFLKNGGYDVGFPTLADLAVRQKWFAVKNLVRRQVVPFSEFTAKSHGKTAEEWADFHQCKQMAEELRYYASLPSCKLIDSEKKVEDMEKELRAVKQDLLKTKEALAMRDDRIAQLAEMVVTLSGGDGGRDIEALRGREEFCSSLRETWEMDKLTGRDLSSDEGDSKACGDSQLGCIQPEDSEPREIEISRENGVEHKCSNDEDCKKGNRAGQAPVLENYLIQTDLNEEPKGCTTSSHAQRAHNEFSAEAEDALGQVGSLLTDGSTPELAPAEGAALETVGDAEPCGRDPTSSGKAEVGLETAPGPADPSLQPEPTFNFSGTGGDGDWTFSFGKAYYVGNDPMEKAEDEPLQSVTIGGRTQATHQGLAPRRLMRATMKKERKF